VNIKLAVAAVIGPDSGVVSAPAGKRIGAPKAA
jgi:hypothetical protein